MPRFGFGAILSLAVVSVALGPSAAAPQIPGRDLLEYPIGLLAEPAALASLTGDGHRNPASIDLSGVARFRASGASLHTSADEGVSAQLLSIAGRPTETTTVAVGVVRAAVSDLVRTDVDPQTIGAEIPYSATLFSGAVSQRHEHFVAGIAARYWLGQLEQLRRGGFGLDGGLRADEFLHPRLRVGVATYLWQPGGAGSSQSSYNVAADVRLAGNGREHEARVGLAFGDGPRRPSEWYGFVGGQLAELQGRVGLARSRAHGHTDWRMRLGLGIRHARYVIGIAREENEVGRSPVYQFSLTALIP